MHNSRTVLMVEDELEIVEAARFRLQSVGYNLLWASNGHEGLQSAISFRPDVILLDVRMPRKDGLTVLGELKARSDTREIPIIMLSASIVDQKAALDAGALYFLRKPYEGEKLVKMVQSAIAEHDSSDARSPGK